MSYDANGRRRAPAPKQPDDPYFYALVRNIIRGALGEPPLYTQSEMEEKLARLRVNQKKSKKSNQS